MLEVATKMYSCSQTQFWKWHCVYCKLVSIFFLCSAGKLDYSAWGFIGLL